MVSLDPEQTWSCPRSDRTVQSHYPSLCVVIINTLRVRKWVTS